MVLASLPQQRKLKSHGGGVGMLPSYLQSTRMCLSQGQTGEKGQGRGSEPTAGW